MDGIAEVRFRVKSEWNQNIHGCPAKYQAVDLQRTPELIRNKNGFGGSIPSSATTWKFLWSGLNKEAPGDHPRMQAIIPVPAAGLAPMS